MVCKKIVVSNRLRKILSERSNFENYSKNTYRTRYKFIIFIYLVIQFIFLVYMPSYDDELLKNTWEHFIKTDIDVYLRVMLIIFNIYIFISVLDNNVDKTDEYDSLINKDFNSRMNMILFKIYIYTPFLTEI